MNAKALMVLFAAAALAVHGEETARTLYYCDMSHNNKNWSFTLPDGTAVAPSVVAADKGCDVRTAYLHSGWENLVSTLENEFSFHSWTISPLTAATKNTGAFVDGDGAVTLGAGGLYVAPYQYIHFGHKTKKARFKLSASQTWRGPESGSVWGTIGIGSKYNYNGYYDKCCVEALDDLTWTLDGRIKVILTAANSLANVDVVVNPEARLILVEKWSDQTFAGKLGARSLTLKGGDTGSSVPLFTLGAKNPDTRMGATYSPATLDDATVAKHVILQNGADITCGAVDYSISKLTVSGGDSFISGEVSVSKTVDVEIEAGATFAFSGELSVAEGAKINLSGEGAYVAEGGEIRHPFAGNGVIVCENEFGLDTVLRADLSEFTGTIRASGNLLIHSEGSLNAAATVVLAEGCSVREMTGADVGDFTVSGRKIYRDSDGVVHPFLYLNEITKNFYLASLLFRLDQDSGESMGWVDGSVFVFDKKATGGITNSRNDGDLNVAGIIVEETAENGTMAINYFDGDGDMTVGERGIEFRRTGMTLQFFKALDRFRLACSQTWRGPDSETLTSDSARINVGGNWSYMYPSGSVVPLEDDLKLTIEGNLTVYMYYPSNDMSKVDVVVKSPARLAYSYSGGNGSYASGGNTHPWCGRLNAKSLTFDGPSADILIDYPEKFPTLSGTSVAKTVVVKNGATFCVDASKTMNWHGDMELRAGAGGGSVTGKYVLMDEVTRLSAEAGATLDLTGAAFSVKPGVDAGFAVSGEGKVRLSFANLDKIAGPLTIDGAAIEVVGSGAWTDSLARASGFTVVSDDAVSISAAALEGYAGTTVNVASGVLILDSVASLPSGVKVATSGDGALMLLDPEGFDPEVHMEGTKNVATDMSMIVSETPRENEAVNLGDGDILHVFGSGLKASSSLTMGTGSKVLFHRSATISAPVSVAGSALFATVGDSVEGVFAGKLTKSAAASLAVSADGGIVFSGGVTMESSDNAFTLQKGSVTFSDKLVSISSLVRLQAGALIITNCTFYSYAWGWHVGDGSQTDNVLCEVAANATWYVGNNSIIYIGGRNDAESRLRINGGTMWHQTYDTIRLDDDGTGNAVFELASGTLSSQRRILVGLKANSTAGSAKFIWKGGTWKTGGGNPYKYDFLFGPKDAKSVYGGLEFSVEGENCVFDLAGFEKPQNISNFLNLASSKMTGKPGAKLKLKGHPTIGSKMVLLDFEPNGMALDLNENPRVDVDVVGSGSPIHLGWAVPGTNGTVRCIGTSLPLVADYVVADGGVFRNSFVDDHWNSGFSSVTVSNLVFGAGSTYMLEPTVEGLEALSIAGSLYLPAAMKYAVDRMLAPAPVAEGAVLVDSAAGVVDESVWTAAGGISKHDSSVYASEGKLLFNYKPSATILFVR